jgi:hypothetical protein
MYTKGEFPYVLKGDRKLPKEEQAVFQLATLDPEEYAELEDSLFYFTEEREDKTATSAARKAQVEYKTLRRGVKGWDNFKRNGEEVVYKHPGSTRCAKENIAQLHPEDRHELAEAITEGNTLSEEDAKNSESASG